MQEKFNRQIEEYNIHLKKYNTISGVVGYIKLLLVILLGISVYLMFSKQFTLELILWSILLFIALVIFWIYHGKLHEKIDYANGIISINRRHLDRITGKWIDFTDIGEEYIDPEHAYACDLDIVGKKSLFQFLGITHTWHGREAFAKDLLYPNYSQEELLKRQEAVSELSKNIELACQMEYHYSKIGTDSSVQNLVNELKDKQLFLKNKGLKYILTYLPLCTIAAVLSIFIFQTKTTYLISTCLIAIQVLLWIVGLPKNHKYLRHVSGLPYKLRNYGTVVDILINESFTSEKLKQMGQKLGTSHLSAAEAMKDLAGLSEKRNVAHIGILYIVLNILLLWDYHCAFLYEDWKNKYAEAAEDWFLILGEFESLLCFSILPNVCQNTSLPVLTTQKNIESAEMGHPLLADAVRVNNDFCCNNNIFVISGSNMSGKTTFLRTVGINLVLARAGAFVCAKQLLCPVIDIMTSMRITDDLNEGVSTFYAELKRIKTMIEYARKEPNMIFLIDEIFRGTNSVDRLIGAKTVISELNELKAIGMITTHDLELCELSKVTMRIKNYSFTETYTANELRFDYKIKEGKSNTTNAKYLMKMVGIIS